MDSSLKKRPRCDDVPEGHETKNKKKNKKSHIEDSIAIDVQPSTGSLVSLEVLESMLDKKLDEKQKQVIRDLLGHGKNTVCVGAAGCGKSAVILEVTRICEALGLVCTVTALTGRAASHVSGMTLHKFIGAGWCEESKSIEVLLQKVLRNSEAVELWIKTDVLIIDEISMKLPRLLHILDRAGKTIRKNRDLPFGGIRVFMAGDFLQLPPVVKGNKDFPRLFKDKMYREYFQCVHNLKAMYRQKDPEFLAVLQRVRIGKATTKDDAAFYKKVREGPKIAAAKSHLITTLLATNEEVNSGNLEMLQKHTNKSTWRTFTSTSGLVRSGPWGSEKSFKLWVADMEKGQAPKSIVLGTNARVMLQVNLDVKSHLTNGSTGMIVEWKTEDGEDLPVVRFDKTGERVLIRKHVWKTEFKHSKGWYKQIPLRLGWYCTIDKGQGLSLPEAAMNLAHLNRMGQFYTALSRVETWAGVILLGYTGRSSIVVDKQAIEYYKALDIQQESKLDVAKKEEDVRQ